jgi:hypothetical protein
MQGTRKPEPFGEEAEETPNLMNALFWSTLMEPFRKCGPMEELRRGGVGARAKHGLRTMTGGEVKFDNWRRVA